MVIACKIEAGEGVLKIWKMHAVPRVQLVPPGATNTPGC